MANMDVKEVYRGEAMDYQAYRCLPSIFRLLGEGDRLFEEACYYVRILSNDAITHLLDYDLDKKLTLKQLGAMQHYGLQSRLLDVSANPNVALYFACSEHFTKDGMIYSFSEKQFRLIRNDDVESINRRVDLLIKPDQLYQPLTPRFLKDNHLRIDNTTLTRNVLVDYNITMGAKTNNIRYQHQAGMFIFPGFVVADDIVGSEPVAVEVNETQIIHRADKLEKLLTLAMDQSQPIHHVFLFPDASESLNLTKEFNLIAVSEQSNQITKCRTFIKTRYKDTGSLVEHLSDDQLSLLISNPHCYYFVNYEYWSYYQEIKKDSDVLLRLFTS